jgi:ferredoxin
VRAPQPTSPRGGSGPAARPDRPVLPPPSTTPEVALAAKVRRFHLRGEAEGLAPLGQGALPALLARFADEARVRTGYPLVVTPAAQGPWVRSLGDALADAATAFGDARILKDNLLRLEKGIREATAAEAAPAMLQATLRSVGAAMVQALNLAPAGVEQLTTDLEALIESFPKDALLLGLGPHTATYLFVLAAHQAAAPRRKALAERLEKALAKVEALLAVERKKDPSAHGAGALEVGVGRVGASLFSPAALSAVLGAPRGATALAPTRRARLEAAVEALKAWYAAEDPVAILLHDGALEAEQARLADGCVVERRDDPGRAVVARFDAEARRWAERYRALRVAELEVAGRWDEAHHAAWLESFDWEAFSRDELMAMPPVLALISASEVAEADLLPVSHALTSGRPVKLLVATEPLRDPRGDGDGASGFRLELGYLGVGHREAFVLQGSIARPTHLGDGYRAALGCARAALLVLDGAGRAPDAAVGPWLYASAGVEGRAHPLFTYAPEAGGSWAARLSVGDNPDPEADWVQHALACQDRTGGPVELPVDFTFVDCALLDPGMARHFARVPTECPEGDLLPMAGWLALDDEDAARKVPYIWVDEGGELWRAAVTRRLAWVARDRQAFWRLLRELGGVKNAHVEAAVAAAGQAARAELERKLAEQAAAHAAALEAARRDAAREAMERLTAVLLDLDAGPLAMSAAPRPAPKAAPAPAVAAPVAEAPTTPAPVKVEAKKAEAPEAEEPWVDSPLCTSCNDCVALNPALFVYDGNKQVRIGDPKAGPFAQLVKAAESCPAKCIHPGTPLNPDEPGLDDLRARAARFN